MKVAGLFHKFARWDATVMPAQQLLDFGTINGAKSIGMSDKLGSIEIGKYADRKMELQQGTEILEYDHLTLSLTKKQIETVLGEMGDNAPGGNNFSIALVSYAEGAKLTTQPEKTTVNEFGETEKVTRV
mgnify:CR=1 FL=1